MHQTPLHAPPLAVNDAHAAEPGAARFLQIFHQDPFDVARRDGVKIENVCDLQPDGFKEEVVRVKFVLALIRCKVRFDDPAPGPAARGEESF